MSAIPKAPPPPSGAIWDPKSPKFHAYNCFYGLCRAWAEDVVEKRKCTHAAAFKVINKIVDGYQNRGPIKYLKEQFNKRQFTVPMSEDKDLPWYALAGLRMGEFTLGEIVTYLTFRDELSYHKADIYAPVPLFQEGTPNPKAVELIKKTLEPVQGLPPENPVKDANIKKEPLLNEAQIKQLFALMKEKPLFEQQFLVLPASTATIAEAVYLQGFNIFGRIPVPNGDVAILLPSFGLMEAFLTVKHGYPVKMNPVLGLSSVTAIFKNALLGTREVYLAFPGRERPKKVDLQDAIGAEITHPHDWAHVNWASSVPRDHQWGFALLSQIVQEMASEKEFAQVQPFLMRIRELLIDMEHNLYKKELSIPPFEGQEPSILFWKSLSYCFQKAALYLTVEKGGETY